LNSFGKPAVPVLLKFSKSERNAGSGYFRNVKEPTLSAKEWGQYSTVFMKEPAVIKVFCWEIFKKLENRGSIPIPVFLKICPPRQISEYMAYPVLYPWVSVADFNTPEREEVRAKDYGITSGVIGTMLGNTVGTWGTC
jgi:hypothetical protein